MGPVHVQTDAMLSTNANATMQDGESDALVKLRRGVNIYDGSADHDGRLAVASLQEGAGNSSCGLGLTASQALGLR